VTSVDQLLDGEVLRDVGEQLLLGDPLRGEPLGALLGVLRLELGELRRRLGVARHEPRFFASARAASSR
jgi:hypothetical protein